MNNYLLLLFMFFTHIHTLLRFLRQQVSFLLSVFLFISVFLVFEDTFASSVNTATLVFQTCEKNRCTDVASSVFEKKFEIGEKIPMRVVIKNPEKAPIFSVQSWVKYDPEIFSLSGLSDAESAFDLAAPGEFKAVNSKGEMRVGRAVTGSSVSDEESIVFDFVVEVKKNPNNAVFEFMDFKNNEIGKTSIVTITNNIPANILSEKPKNLVFKNLKSSAYPLGRATQETLSSLNNEGVSTDTVIQNVQEEEIVSSSVENTAETVTALPRPVKFRTRTNAQGQIDFIWEQLEDKNISGYYLYYSTTSGIYMHRRDVGKTNVYTFNEGFFKKGQQLFFAVQAYSSNETLSDFSDETTVIVGQEGTESHPFFEQIFPDAEKAGVSSDGKKQYYVKEGQENLIANSTQQYPTPNSTPQSGVDVNILVSLFGVFMLMGSGMYFMVRRED